MTTRLYWRARLRIATSVLVGQVVGLLVCVTIFCGLGVAASTGPAVAMLVSATPTIDFVFFALFPLTLVVAPILFADELTLHRHDVRPATVSASAAALAIGVFAVGLRATGGQRRAVGGMLPALAIMVPLASILGSFLGTFVPPPKRPTDLGTL